MVFTYEGYARLLQMLLQYGYRIISFEDFEKNEKSAILRHDIDYNLDKTIRIAEIENGMGAKSTFFLLLCTDFYNIFSAKACRVIDKILSLGHEIGLHFDEQRYPNDFGDPDRIRDRIVQEADLLSHATGLPVTKVSMHRPSKTIIESNLSIPNMINTYGKRYFTDFKYVSDSRRRWREPVDEYIINGVYDRFQILVHPFWYNEQELNLRETIKDFISLAPSERYCELNDNFTNLEEILDRKDI